MPIYEYKCEQCNKVFEEFIRTDSDLKNLKCPSCNSNNLKKIMSLYSAFGLSNDEREPSNDSSSPLPSCGCNNGSCNI